MILICWCLLSENFMLVFEENRVLEMLNDALTAPILTSVECRWISIMKMKNKVKCENTPAKEYEITDSKWTLRDLLTFISVKILIT